MKKAIINIIFILLIILLYYLQLNFFNWFSIAGIMPNLFIILVVFIALFSNKNLGIIYGIIIGLFLDLLMGKVIGVNAVVYGIIGFMAATFEKNFSKDSRVTIILVVVGTTIFGEVAVNFINYILLNSSIDVWAFVKILSIETIYNVLLSIILYPIIQRFGFYIENEYKGNQILTRYF